MGDGFGHLIRRVVIVFLSAGLSCLVVACSGTAQQQTANAASRQAGDAQAASSSTAGPVHAGALRFDEEIDATHLQRQFESVARRVIPSVVAISAIDLPVSDETLQHPDQVTPQRLDAALHSIDRTVGTGFVIDSAGYIVTNEHVVGKARQLWVTTDDQKVYPAVVVGSDPRSDLAVLKIPAKNLHPVRLAPTAQRGQWAMAIGNPYGLAGDGEMAVSVGVVSAMGRSLPKLSGKEDRLYQDLIQTTAQINPGNSGGPLFDLNGDVIGINCAVILPVKQTNGIGFALPLNPRVRSVIDRLKAGQEVTYGYMGVRTSTPSEHELRQANLPARGGAKVDHIEQGSPAEAAGMRTGDYIVHLNGEPVTDSERFTRLVGEQPVDGPVPILVHRSGKPAKLAVTLRPRALASAPVTRETQRFTWRGLLLGSRPAHNGVVILAIETDSPLAGKVKQGDVLESIGGIALKTLPELLDVLGSVPFEQCAVKVASKQPEPVVSARE